MQFHPKFIRKLYSCHTIFFFFFFWLFRLHHWFWLKHQKFQSDVSPSVLVSSWTVNSNNIKISRLRIRSLRTVWWIWAVLSEVSDIKTLQTECFSLRFSHFPSYTPRVTWWWRPRSESSSVCVYSLFKWNGRRGRTGCRGVLWEMWFWLRATENVVLCAAALKNKHFWVRWLRFFPFKAGRLRLIIELKSRRLLLVSSFTDRLRIDLQGRSRLLQETWTLLLAARTLSSSNTSSAAVMKMKTMMMMVQVSARPSWRDAERDLSCKSSALLQRPEL